MKIKIFNREICVCALLDTNSIIRRKQRRKEEKMTITKNTENGVLTLALEGRLDTNTAPELEKEIGADLTADVQTLILDLKDLEYISSAGLRVLLAAQKKMNKQGNMVVKNANDMIMDVFQVTGFIDILTVE